MATRVAVQPGMAMGTDAPAISEPHGLWSWLTTVDHKRIGIMYLILSLTFLAIGGIEAMLIRVQLARPGSDFLSADTYNQVFTMHGTTMIFLAVMPLSGAFFNFLVPLMIGARDVAFPRLNAFSLWLLVFGAILINVGWLVGEAPNAGWFSYANLTSSAYSPGRNVDFWILGLQVLGLSSLAASFNFTITIINMRAPGMSMMRMPVFVWMTMITQVMIALAFPPLTVGVTLLMLDRFYGSTFFNPEMGGSPLLWQHLFWTFGHPEVYIMILPAFGIISEVLPVFSRKPLFGYSAVVFSGVAIAVLGFGVWAHHMFTVGMGPVPVAVFAISTMLIALPTGVKIFNWIGTLWGGDLVFKTPMLFALGFIAMFIIGGISGVMHGSPPVDSQHQDSYFVVAHFHYVLFGGSLFGLFAGIYYWFPKFSGKLLNEKLGKVHFWFMFVGFNLVFFPMHWLGVQGMPRRIYTYTEEQNWGFWNMFISLGLFVLVFGFVIFAINVLMTLVLGERASDDPWDGATLEWSIPSPPPVYNFATVPVVTSRTPLWSKKYPEIYGGEDHGVHGVEQPATGHEHEREHAVAGAFGDDHDHADDAHDAHDAHGHDSIHMPNPSIWPLVAALGIAIGFGGFLVNYFMIGVGVFMLVVAIWSWALEPAVGHGSIDSLDDSAHAAAH